jgi:hypothetical protein
MCRKRMSNVRLPAAGLCGSIHIEDLTTHPTRGREVKNGIGHIAHLDHFLRGVQCSDKVQRLIHVRRRVHHARRDGVEPNAFLCILDCQAARYCIQFPFVIIGTEAFSPATGLSAWDAEMLTTHPDSCFSICFTLSCVM